MKLNLQAKDESQKRILEYLEQNASDTLANKINNGVQIEKDDIQLLSKKDLDSFMSYAQNEARKLAEQGKNYACIEDKTVFGWAIHYFEEESIEGKLCNLDGSEYNPPKPEKTISTKSTPKVEIKKKDKEQLMLFDIYDMENKNQELDPLFDEEIEEKEPSIETISGQNIDTTTGEVISANNETFDKYILKTIAVAFDGKVKLQ